MAADNQVSSVLVQQITDLKARLELSNEVLNVFDWAIDSALEQLEHAGHLPPEAGLLEEYRRAVRILRKRGFRTTGPEGEVQCPGCKAMLKGVALGAGDRCCWCGQSLG
jgi:hypothetical protein